MCKPGWDRYDCHDDVYTRFERNYEQIGAKQSNWGTLWAAFWQEHHHDSFDHFQAATPWQDLDHGYSSHYQKDHIDPFDNHYHQNQYGYLAAAPTGHSRNYLKTRKPVDPNLANLLSGVISLMTEVFKKSNNGHILTSGKMTKAWRGCSIKEQLPEAFIIVDSNEMQPPSFKQWK